MNLSLKDKNIWAWSLRICMNQKSKHIKVNGLQKIALVNLLILQTLLYDGMTNYFIPDYDSLRSSTNSGIPLNSVAIKINFFVSILIQL
jgi:hypothetical protein